jgi:uncharacterized membrane protein SirB2
LDAANEFENSKFQCHLICVTSLTSLFFLRYYLQQYGTQQDLLQFWLKYNLLEDAIRYLINQYSVVITSQTPNNNNSSNLLSTNVENSATNEQQKQQLVAVFIDLVLHVLSHNNLKQFHQIIHKIGTF